MKKLVIISLGLLFSCLGPTSELEATRNTDETVLIEKFEEFKFSLQDLTN